MGDLTLLGLCVPSNCLLFPSKRAISLTESPQTSPPSPEVCSTFPRAQWVSRHQRGPNEDESALISHLVKAWLIYLWWFGANLKCFVAGLKVRGDFLISIYELEIMGECSQPVSYLLRKPIFFKENLQNNGSLLHFPLVTIVLSEQDIWPVFPLSSCWCCK